MKNNFSFKEKRVFNLKTTPKLLTVITLEYKKKKMFSLERLKDKIFQLTLDTKIAILEKSNFSGYFPLSLKNLL